MILTNVRLDEKLCDLVIREGKIAEIRPALGQKGDFDGQGMRLLPGLVDVHAHGFGGRDTMDGDLLPMAADLARRGTTSWLPTTMTSAGDDLMRVCEAAKAARAAQAAGEAPLGCRILGVHLEGPFISRRYKGAQNEAHIRPADFDEFAAYPGVRMITVAPETDGCLDFIRRAADGGCIVSLGHSAASYEQACAALEAGAVCVTHLYNAMPPFHHRETGIIGAAFIRRPYAQLICDGLHVSAAAVLTAYRMLGPDRLILISDSIRPAGLADGDYESGGLAVHLRGRECRLDDGTLAGSASSLFACVKTAASMGIPLSDALRMASRTPARLLGLSCGAVEVGLDADLLLVDDELELRQVFIGGRPVEGVE